MAPLNKDLPEDQTISQDTMDKIEEEKLDAMNSWFAERDIFVPDAAYDSDGLVLKLVLRGIKKQHVAGHDVVVVKDR